MATPIRVLCVDDNHDITHVLTMLINADPKMECVGSLDSADELAAVIADTNPDVVLLDAGMPGKDPFQALRELSKWGCHARIILFSGHNGDEFTQRALEAGAWGCICKDEDPEALLNLIRNAAQAPGNNTCS